MNARAASFARGGALGAAPTPSGRACWFDFSWIWGPPEDHFAQLLRTVGAERFVYGTGWPLRLTQNARALLDLLPDDVADPRLADADALARLASAG